MIITKTERLYTEARKRWMKHGRHDKELTYQVVKRITIYFLLVPIFYTEKIIKTDL